MLTFIADANVLPCVEDYLKAVISFYGLDAAMRTWESIREVPPGGVIVFVQRIPPPAVVLAAPACKFGFLNIEQLTRPAARSWLESNVSRPDVKLSFLLDYSPANQKVEGTAIVIPFPPTDPPFPNAAAARKVAFVGALSPRRKAVLLRLVNAGVAVEHIQGWGEDRDRRIAECRVLLNIHYAPEYRVFESFRCVPWVYHPSVTVVSESSDNMEEEWVYPLIGWARYDDLVDSVLRALEAPKVQTPRDDAATGFFGKNPWAHLW